MPYEGGIRPLTPAEQRALAKRIALIIGSALVLIATALAIRL